MTTYEQGDKSSLIVTRLKDLLLVGALIRPLP
jgi:hypothetical protein